MAKVSEIAAPWAGHLHAVVRQGDVVCPCCHSARGRDFADCYSCGHTTGREGVVTEIVPITYWDYGTPTGTLLSTYKDPNSPRFNELRAVIREFLLRHQRCVTRNQRVSSIVTIPSTRGRPPPHPMHRLMSTIYRPDAVRQTLTHTGLSPERNTVQPGLFHVTGDVRAQKLLLVDDTMTTGNRIQSAAVALSRAGGTVVGALVAGRKIDRSFGNTPDLLELSKKQGFAWEVCGSAAGCYSRPAPTVL